MDPLYDLLGLPKTADKTIDLHATVAAALGLPEEDFAPDLVEARAGRLLPSEFVRRLDEKLEAWGRGPDLIDPD